MTDPGFVFANYVPVHRVEPSLIAQEILEVQPMAMPTDLMFELVFTGGGEEMRVLHGMTIEAKREEVLVALKANRKEHAEIVAEAKEGYAKKAEELLKKALGDVREGKVDPLNGWSASLRAVVDHTKVYDRVIKMFELEQRDVVKLTQEQVGSLIMDEWAWKEEFIGSNALYSRKAMEFAER